MGVVLGVVIMRLCIDLLLLGLVCVAIMTTSQLQLAGCWCIITYCSTEKIQSMRSQYAPGSLSTFPTRAWEQG